MVRILAERAGFSRSIIAIPHNGSVYHCLHPNFTAEFLGNFGKIWGFWLKFQPPFTLSAQSVKKQRFKIVYVSPPVKVHQLHHSLTNYLLINNLQWCSKKIKCTIVPQKVHHKMHQWATEPTNMNLDKNYRIIADDDNFILQRKLQLRGKKRTARSKAWQNIGFWKDLGQALKSYSRRR
ncbi:MAG: hypothetical protein O7G29_05565, partial [Acidobacteria bacterium]|nr:hypothetical protein [Acidobacteriota bacterium]